MKVNLNIENSLVRKDQSPSITSQSGILPPFFANSSPTLRKVKAQEKMALALQGNLRFPLRVCSVDFKNGKVDSSQAKVSFDPGNGRFFLNAMTMEKPGISFIQADLENFKKLPSATYNLELSHFRAVESGRIWDYTLGIDLIVNGETIRKNYLPPTMHGRDAPKEQFDITPYLKEGKNTIRIELSQQDGSMYALRELSINQI